MAASPPVTWAVARGRAPAGERASSGHLLPGGVELPQIGDQVFDPLFVLDAGEDHLRSGNLGARIPDVVSEDAWLPHDSGISIGGRIGKALDRPSRPAE